MTLSTPLVKSLAAKCGFHACGMAPAEDVPLFDAHLEEWLSQGYHGDMRYMEAFKEMRSNVTQLFPGARSVISLLVGYKPSLCVPNIAMYAYGEDYHERIKRMLYQLIAAIKEIDPSFEAKPCVDTAPIAEKLWAWRAGLGWIGRNTLFYHPTMGSFCLIGELVTTAEFDYYGYPRKNNNCGNCYDCIEACPNHAITPQGINAPCCTSYNTIENRADTLPSTLRTEGYCFGCDICQIVCPYNQFAEIKENIPQERIQELSDLSSADAPTFRRLTKHSALNRINYAQWQRNIQHNSEGKE